DMGFHDGRSESYWRTATDRAGGSVGAQKADRSRRAEDSDRQILFLGPGRRSVSLCGGGPQERTRRAGCRSARLSSRNFVMTGNKIARRMRDAGPLVNELMNVRMTMSGNGRVRMGADANGEHDDL